MRDKLRIGMGQGFWGDWEEAPVHLVRHGNINYLVLDYLAELTMSILAHQKKKDPKKGFAHDFVKLIEAILLEIVEKGIKVIANAGGVNPISCAESIKQIIEQGDLKNSPKIAVVTGDDILPKLLNFKQLGQAFSHLDTGEKCKLEDIKVSSANAYLGADTIVEALKNDAQIIITGRVADASMVLAPLIYECGWKSNDWDNLARGIIAGHILECSAQATGGNCSFDWENIPNLAGIGYPILEVNSGEEFIITKADNSGGRVDLRSVKEQLVYEIGNPKEYITPDVIADFTSVTLEQVGENRVKLAGGRGRPRPDSYKVSLSYENGFRAEGTLIYSWPDAYKKALAAQEILKSRFAAQGLKFEEIITEIIGAGACHGEMLSTIDKDELPEVVCRIAVRTKDKDTAEKFTRGIAPLVLNGPPSATGYASGRPKPMPVYSYWPTLIPRELVNSSVGYY